MSSKLEEKKVKRKQRALEWAKFLATKPNDKDDPFDMEKIKR
jgi:hypothetical protein